MAIIQVSCCTVARLNLAHPPLITIIETLRRCLYINKRYTFDGGSGHLKVSTSTIQQKTSVSRTRFAPGNRAFDSPKRCVS